MSYKIDNITGNWNLPVNLTEKQRTVSAIAGGVLLALGVLDFSKSSFRRAVRMTLGSLMLMRSRTGYCPLTAAIKKTADKVEDAAIEPAYSGE